MGRYKAIKPFKGRLSRSGHVSGGPMEDAGFRYGRGDFFYLFVCLIAEVKSPCDFWLAHGLGLSWLPHSDEEAVTALARQVP